MKKAIIASLSMLMCISAHAQKNRIEFGTGGYRFFNVLGQMDEVLNMVSVRYKRDITRRAGIFVGYNRLPIKGWLLVFENVGLAKESVGKMTSRDEHNYFDLGISYTVLRHRRHSVSAIACLSLAYGVNEYLRYVVWTEPEPGEPYGHPIEAVFEEKKETYFGGLAGIRYDFHFWRNRINIGAEFAARQYANDFPFQVNYGLHTGFNF